MNTLLFTASVDVLVMACQSASPNVKFCTACFSVTTIPQWDACRIGTGKLHCPIAFSSVTAGHMSTLEMNEENGLLCMHKPR